MAKSSKASASNAGRVLASKSSKPQAKHSAAVTLGSQPKK
jgi:hypothetical protein